MSNPSPQPLVLQLSRIESSGEYRVLFKQSGKDYKETTCNKVTGDLLLNPNTDPAVKSLFSNGLLKKAMECPPSSQSQGTDGFKEGQSMDSCQEAESVDSYQETESMGSCQEAESVDSYQETENDLLELETVQHEESTSTGAKFIWSRPATSLLLDQVKEKEPLIRRGKMTKKRMYQEIRDTLNTEMQFCLTEEQVSNRHKSILRGYKNIKDNNKKTGAERKTHPYQQQLDEIMGSDPNITPASTISSVEETTSQPQESPKKKKQKKSNYKNSSVEEIKMLITEESEKTEKRINGIVKSMEKMHQEKMSMFREIFCKDRLNKHPDSDLDDDL